MTSTSTTKNHDSLMYKLVQSVKRSTEIAVQEAFKAGQSDDAKLYKEELEQTLAHAKDALSWIEVTQNRIASMSGNYLEHTTNSYLNNAAKELHKIKGINS